MSTTDTTTPETGSNGTAAHTQDQNVFTDKAQALDTMRLLLFGRVTRYYLKQLMEAEGNGPLTVGAIQGTAKGCFGQLKKLDELLAAVMPPNNMDWLNQPVPQHILFNISTITELVVQVGTEENDRYYQEFLMLLIDTLKSVMFFRDTRRSIHFGKYKRFFEFIGEELERDALKQKGRMRYENGKLWLCIEDLNEPKEGIKQ